MILDYDKKVCTYGDFKTWIQYVGEEDRAALAIARRRGGSAYVIPNEALCFYVDLDGYHSPYMEQRAPEIARHIGLSADRKTCFRLAEAILKGIEDVINFPPPMYRDKPDTEVDMTVDGTHYSAEVAL